MEPAKNLDELAWNCVQYETIGDAFPRLVDDCIRLVEGSVALMQSGFGVSRSTVYRWAEGLSVPHLSVQWNVIAAIRRYALGVEVLRKIPLPEIEKWLVMGGERKATHMFIVYDMHAKETIHPYVVEGEKVSDKMTLYHSEPTFCILAIFSFAKILAKQLAEDHPWHPE